MKLLPDEWAAMKIYLTAYAIVVPAVYFAAPWIVRTFVL